MATGAVIARILTQYSAVGSKAAKRDIANLGKSFDHFAKRATQAFAVAGAAGAAFAVKTGIDSIKAAMDDQKSQVLLANSLRNTTGASDAAIASMEDYIGKLQLAVGVADDKLRPSLSILASATGNLTQAQRLQGIALDISARRNLDLEAVSLALAKAQNGNVGALQKLGIKLSAATLKSKNFYLAQQELAKTFKGASAAAAETMTGRLERMKIAYSEIQETLGYALLPVVMKFTDYIVTNVLPKIQLWVDANKDKLAKSFQAGIDLLVTLTKKAVAFGEWIADHMGLVKAFAAILAATFVVTKIAAFVAAINTITAAMVALRATTVGAAVAMAFATGGTSVLAATAALAVASLTYNFLDAKKAADQFTDAQAKAALAAAGLTGPQGASEYAKKVAKDKAVIDAKNRKEQAAADKIAAATAAKSLANAKVQLALEAMKAAKALTNAKNLLKVLPMLAAFGIKPKTEEDPITLEAARQNLVKQGNLLELAKFEAMKKNLEVQMAMNASAQRYADIMAALADNQISTQEIAVLASKWKISSDQVTEYIARIFAANSTPTNDGAILKLYMAWGLTKDEASKYLDFAKALKDEKLDPSEIEKLMGKWGLSRQAVLDYGALVAKGTAISSSWSAPGDLAASGWMTALNAFNAYKIATGIKPATSGPGAALGRGGDQGPSRASSQGTVFSPTTSYGNDSVATASDTRFTTGGGSGGDTTITFSIDSQAFRDAMQSEYQVLIRNGSPLSGTSSRGG